MKSLAACALLLSGSLAHAYNFSTYFANWAQYHANGYSFTAQDLAPIVNRLTEINYAFLYFCPPPGTTPMPYWSLPPYGACTDATAYQLMSVDPHDAEFLATIAGYRSSNPQLKLMLSVGGWNFPASYWSALAATASSRTTFIQSVQSWMQQYGADGVDIDWEYPVAPPRSDPVEISCTDFETVNDAGGKPADTANIVTLFAEMRAALGPSKRITVASQASKPLEIEMAIAQLDQYVDSFHLMTYDYTVSDVVGAEAAVLAPNQPLYTPANPAVTQMSVNYTISNYLAAGVHPSKIMLGIALYGHTWFSPGLADGGSDKWKGFGQPAQVQGACCGPFVNTRGAQPGSGSSLCGTYMYSEIVRANAQLHTFDEETQSDIAYFNATGSDGTTAAGTFITYNGLQSVAAITDYAKKMGLAGVFTFDSSMDSLSEGGQWTYELSNAIADALNRPHAAPAVPAVAPAAVPVPAPAAPLKMAPSAPFVGSYVMLNGPDGLAKLQLLASQAATLPITRLWLAFVSPTMVYVPGSNTLQNVGWNLTRPGGDYGFAAVKAAINKLNSSGIEVFISIGGWDSSCFPMLYTVYSVAGYGTNTPNYWKVQEYCGGSVSQASAANEYCYTCEPPSANETLNAFSIFPQPTYSATWQQATAYVAATAGGVAPPAWDNRFVPGSTFTDSQSGLSSIVPGSPLPFSMKRDPYADVVHLAAELGAAGVDIDYEEDWFADMHKNGPAGGPWTIEQTVYKFAAIAKDVSLNIAAIAPHLKISTAASAAGSWGGNWWGGNEKGVILDAAQWYPDLIAEIASGGGINVMSYDLSDNEQYYECPEPGVCSLDQQVQFYMQQYATAGIPANVGYETGTPAYPDPVHDPTHQLPLTQSALGLIISETQAHYSGGFFWEIFKQPAAGADEASPTQVAQALCKAIFPSSPRCSGTIPQWTGA
jgi:GH18 family chitinase